ncbi:tail fiber assembly protein [Escherichia coli]|nr:tail fiber assembly protein [Escherichia coli]
MLQIWKSQRRKKSRCWKHGKSIEVLLNRVDTSTAQDIEWPALP